MPLLEYRCDSCSKTNEVLVLAGDAAAKPVCASCGSHDMQRLLSTFATFAAHAAGSASSSRGFDPETACGGGACRMPDVCGSGSDDFDA